MNIAKIVGVVAIVASASACQHTQTQYPNDDLQTIASLISSGIGHIDIDKYPVRTFYQANGSYCESYRFRQLVPGGYKYGVGTACRYKDQQWVLTDRVFDAPASTTPQPNTGASTTPPPSTGGTTPPPSTGSSSGGSWVPLNF